MKCRSRVTLVWGVLLTIGTVVGQEITSNGDYDAGGVNLTVRSARCNVGGHWEHPDWLLQNGATLYVKSSCTVNNNDYSKQVAGLSEVTGSGRNRDTLIFDAGFNCDHMGYDPSYGTSGPAFDSWANNGYSNGWSIVWYSNLTVVTNHTQNLQSISKIGYSGDYSHHGLIMFGSYNHGNYPVTWIVQTNDQYYDAGISWGTDLDIVLKKNLTYDFAGKAVEYIHDARIHFGPDIMGTMPTTCTVYGPGILTLNGPPGHYDGSHLVIKNSGNLVVNIDQNADNIPYMNAASNPFLHPVRTCSDNGQGVNGCKDLGPFLELDVLATASATFTPALCEIRRLANAGTLVIGQGAELDIKETATFESEGTLRFSVTHGVPGRLDLHGSVNISGKIELEALDLPAGTYPVITAQVPFSGRFSESTLMPGVSVLYTGTTVSLIVAQNITSAKIVYPLTRQNIGAYQAVIATMLENKNRKIMARQMFLPNGSHLARGHSAAAGVRIVRP